jgi:hypothetical protein
MVMGEFGIEMDVGEGGGVGNLGGGDVGWRVEEAILKKNNSRLKVGC